MNTGKPSLFLCRSPLQLLNCIEACEHFGLRGTHTVMVCAWRAERDKHLMQRLLDLYPHWSELHFFPLYPTKGQLPVMLKVFRGRRHFAHLFYGDSTHLINVFLNKVGRFDSIHLVDDGAATLHRAHQIATRVLHRQRKNFTPRGRLGTALQAGLGLSPMFLYRARFFTFYPISQPELAGTIDRNELAFCKSRIGEKPRTDEVWFIGSDIRREVLARREDYDAFLEQVHRRIDLSKVVYIPHRKEPDDYLAEISKRYSMEVRRLEAILELELVNAPTLPKAFVSFTSSALDTIDLLIKPPITVFRIPQGAIRDILRAKYDEVYDAMARKGFNIVDLDMPATA
ncbi:hypothetical protein [Zoogloea sp.]|uniref:hypothetical protein n=1 Tax=Zoogloea sp. TaxID=49181 RepID=UPI0035B4DB88